MIAKTTTTTKAAATTVMEPAALSSLMDGDVAFPTATALLRQLSQQPAAHAQLGRYQRIGACLHGGAPALDYVALFAAIQTKIAAEPTVLAPRALSKSLLHGASWKGFVSGGAVAASLVAALFIGMNNVHTQLPDAGLSVTAALPAATSETAVVAAGPQDDDHLRSYLKQHENLLAADGLNGGLPLAFMVGYNRY
jgi:negative regulator of sigma E activity